MIAVSDVRRQDPRTLPATFPRLEAHRGPPAQQPRRCRLHNGHEDRARGLTAPGTWQGSLQADYNALFAQFTRAEILEKVEDVEEASILAEFNQVARLIGSGDQEAASAAMRSLTTKVNRVMAKSGASA